MKKLTILLLATFFVVKHFELTDTTTNLYINPISFLGLVIVACFLLATYNLVKKIVDKLGPLFNKNK
jgi:hypothetical protein